MSIFEDMHNKKVYDPSDAELLAVQQKCLLKLYEFNNLSPLETEKRSLLLKEMFAEIGDNCYIEPPFHANFGGKHIHLGNNVYANFNLTAVDDTHIYIGDNVMIGPNVTIATASHPVLPEKRLKGLQYNLAVHIGKNVWIGANAVILPGVTIGENSVIGAGSVVTKDISSNVVAVGNPCKVLRKINDNDKIYYHKDLKF